MKITNRWRVSPREFRPPRLITVVRPWRFPGCPRLPRRPRERERERSVKFVRNKPILGGFFEIARKGSTDEGKEREKKKKWCTVRGETRAYRFLAFVVVAVVASGRITSFQQRCRVSMLIKSSSPPLGFASKFLKRARNTY